MKRIESIKNERIRAWKKLQTRKGREKSGRFLIEGAHLIEEALRAGVDVETILIEEGVTFPIEHRKRIETIIVSAAVMKELSETKSPQGIIAVCRTLKRKPVDVQTGMFLLVDRIQDPGNLGTVIRTADSAGVRAIFLGEGTVDVYNSKVIRASQGSLFHVPFVYASLPDIITELKRAKIPVYGTALREAIPYTNIHKGDSFALLVGNEGEGVHRDLLRQTDANLFIPIYGKAESLNVAVATGILLYSLRQP